MEAYTEGKRKVCKPFKIDYSLDDADLGALNTLDEFNGWYIRDKFSKDTSDIINRELSDLLERGGTKREFAQTLETALEDHVTESKQYWELLADHTLTKIQNMGHVSGYETAGVQYVKIVAVIDNKTTPICRAMNNKVFKVADFRKQYDKIIRAAEKHDLKAYKAAQPMVNGKAMKGEISDEDIKKLGIKLPPYHFRCRTTHVAYFSDPDGIIPKLSSTNSEGRPSNPNWIVSEQNEAIDNISNVMKGYMEKYGKETPRGFRAIRSKLLKESELMDTNGSGVYSISQRQFEFKNHRIFLAETLNKAILKIQKGEALSIQEEAVTQTFWHEIYHNKATAYDSNLTKRQRLYMETVNEFASRKTYHLLIERLGGTAMHQKELIKESLGYQKYVAKFQGFIDECNINIDNKSFKELENIVLKHGYNKVETNLKNWAIKNSVVKGETKKEQAKREVLITQKVAEIIDVL